MKILLFLLAFLTVAFGLHTRLTKPVKCSKNDPQLGNCLLKTVEAMRGNLIAGTVDSDLPALDPFRMDYFHTTYNDIDVQAWNIKATRGGEFKIKHFKVNLSKSHYDLEATVLVPRLTITAHYKFDKYILIFHNVLDGSFRGEFSGIKAMVKAIATPSMKNGKTYLSLKTLGVELTIDDGSISLGDNFIANYVEDMFQNDKRSMLSELSSTIEREVGPMVHKYTQDLLKKIPVDAVLE